MNRLIGSIVHDERLKLYNQGLSDAKIAKLCGRTPRAILAWRQTYGLPGNPNTETNKGKKYKHYR